MQSLERCEQIVYIAAMMGDELNEKLEHIQNIQGVSQMYKIGKKI